ncbi:hypothetical protein BXY66_2994 [Shimia isoporae]|uniref:Beta-lactamase-related domain-containing protein n=1 Tax=Shimia isoporae TaxID=647720 RepID=A0A4R1N3R0_9RHOB|nr:serine hydrolase [Shimia isoporae]TCL00353.1 hypothetical protein BXY66_2994 [Shimia isoporae]
MTNAINLTRVTTALATGALTAMIALAPVAHAQDRDYSTHHELGLMQGFPPTADKQVDKSNALFGVPHNRWSYQNMNTLFPSASISNAQYPVDLVRAVDGGIERLDVAREDGSKVEFDTYLKETFTDSLVVIQGDKVVFERYLNGMNANQPHQMMSVTKSFAGLFGLMAAHEGLVDENDPVTKYVPELAESGAFGQATFKHALDMTASMDFSEDYADPNSGISAYAKVLGLVEATEEERVAETIYEFLPMMQKDSAHENGEIFHYQTPKTDVVNWVTNRATGESFQNNLQDKLWSKLGTDGETYVLLDRNGTLFAGGGLNATPNDLARFATMMLNDGEFNGQQVVAPEVIQELADGGSIEAFTNGTESKGVMGGNDWSYRAQWWVRHTPGHEAFSAIGVNGQWIYIDVERDIAIVKQSSQPESSTNYFDEYNINAFDQIIGHLTK